jgi:hypothetical protein
MFVIVIKRIAPRQAFDGGACRCAQALGVVVMARAEDATKIFCEEITELVRGDGCDGFHGRSFE